MSAADDSDIFIPSVFVGQTAGQVISNDYNYLSSKNNFPIQFNIIIDRQLNLF